MKLGPRTAEQMRRLSRDWKQGEHVLISGGTGSGKTALARHVDQIRLNRGGCVVVFVCKLSPDETILKDYKDFTRWEKWKKNPSPYDKKILLWPKVEKEKTIPTKRALQQDVFGHAFNELSNVGKWNAHIDEGLYVCDPKYLGLGSELGMLHAMGRSSKLTITTLTQRPSHLPLILYSSASHAFVGRTREAMDTKRLAELGGKESARELQGRISAQGRHDFLWVPVATDGEPELVNLKD